MRAAPTPRAHPVHPEGAAGSSSGLRRKLAVGRGLTHGTRRAVDPRELLEVGQVVESRVDLVNAVVEFACSATICALISRDRSRARRMNDQGKGAGREQHDGDQC